MNPPDYPLEPGNPGAIIEGAGLGGGDHLPDLTVPSCGILLASAAGCDQKPERDRATRVLVIPQMRLTTAEILYRLPDFPQLLQSYIWQELDRVPDFPGLKKFLGFWERNLEGPLHSVTVSHSERRLGSFVFAEGELRLQ
ncbi:MAG: hypothetical protein ACK5WY_08370 [Holosporaceae bacterium]